MRKNIILSILLAFLFTSISFAVSTELFKNESEIVMLPMEKVDIKPKVKPKQPEKLNLTYTAPITPTAQSQTAPTESQSAPTPAPAPPPPPAAPPPQSQSNRYVMFSLNVHDFYNWKESIASINRVIDIHEKFNVPVDIYLTDPTVQAILEHEPQLINRLKTSRVVCISYHVRPPAPYYPDFDWYGLYRLSATDLYNLLKNYEEHAIDLKTGQPTNKPGGYEYLKQLIGYPPKIVGLLGGNVAQTLAKVYSEKGAKFAVVHGTQVDLGKKIQAFYVRPEHAELKVYEYKDKNAAEVIANAFARFAQIDKPIFLGIKVHESDFYSGGLSWATIYYVDPRTRRQPLSPPWDFSAMSGMPAPNPIEVTWKIYEDSVRHISENPNLYNAINAAGLEKLL